MNNKKIEPIELSEDNVIYILDEIKKTKVGVIGDACLDVYWKADMLLSELSRETPHFPLPIVDEQMSLGAGGNVAANAYDIGTKDTYILTVVGKDWRGEELMKLFSNKGINTDYVLITDKIVTPAYCKPMRRGISDVVYEDPRIDFENRAAIGKSIEDTIIEQLDSFVQNIDVLLVVDQLKNGIITKRIRERLSAISQMGMPVIVDSRERIQLYKNVIVKPNELEAIRSIYPGIHVKDIKAEMLLEASYELYKKMGNPVIITMGSKGSLWFDGQKTFKAAAYPTEPPIDSVGAGDCFMAAFSSAFGSQIPGHLATAFGNLASSVIITKVGTTGTVTPTEILHRYREVE